MLLSVSHCAIIIQIILPGLSSIPLRIWIWKDLRSVFGGFESISIPFVRNRIWVGFKTFSICLESFWNFQIHFLIFNNYFQYHDDKMLTLVLHLGGHRFKLCTLYGKVGSCLPMVSSWQYRTLTYCMHRFPPATKLPVVIWPKQCWKRLKNPLNK